MGRLLGILAQPLQNANRYALTKHGNPPRMLLPAPLARIRVFSGIIKSTNSRRPAWSGRQQASWWSEPGASQRFVFLVYETPNFSLKAQVPTLYHSRLWVASFGDIDDDESSGGWRPASDH
jgi:hypothetical protein